MSVVGLRVAAFGGRVLFCQRQCKFMMGTQGLSPTLVTVRARLPNKHWPGEARRSQKTLGGQASDLSLQCSVREPFPPATVLTLVNTKEYADGSIMFIFGTSEEATNEGANGATSSGKGRAGSSDQPAKFHGLYEVGQDLNKTDDEEVRESAKVIGQLTSEATAKVNGASNYSTPTANAGNDSSELGMQDQDTKQEFVFNSAAVMAPHPDKVKVGGEDAYFIDGTHWVGVADGVGGWAMSGVNAGHYARELMWNCAERARKVGSTTDPKSVLVYAAKRTKAKGTAATLIASLYKQTLRVANIGDSGFIVVRGTAVVARSKPMLHGFNFPYQIGSEGDNPELSEVYDCQVEKNDIVILGSDGIFDNVFEEQLTAIANSVQQNGGGPETLNRDSGVNNMTFVRTLAMSPVKVLAKELVILAQKIGAAKDGRSPFAVAAHAAGYTRYCGGKLDDTTAVVAYVT